jgi:hypothetical protein
MGWGFPAQQGTRTQSSLFDGRTDPLRDKSRQIPKFAFNLTAEICETPRKSKKFLQIFCKALRRSADPEHLRNPGRKFTTHGKSVGENPKHLKQKGYKAMRTSISTNLIRMIESVKEDVPNWMNPKYHPKSCEELEKLHDFFAEHLKGIYADDEEKLKIRLEKNEVSRQIRIKKEKKRVHKAQLKAEREADPIKMRKHLNSLEKLREWARNKKEEDEAWNNQ